MKRNSRAVVALAVVVLNLAPSAEAAEPATVLKVPQAFHIVGIPGVKRNGRVDIHLTADKLQFQQKEKDALSVPFPRITRMQMLDATRTYAKATYASMVAFGLPGLIMLSKKRHVEILVIDYQNERGGQMGLIVQVPAGRGIACRNWLKQHGVQVDEPEPLPVGGPAVPHR